MEQNDTNSIVGVTHFKKEIPYWNRPSTGLLYLVLIVVAILIYNIWWTPRQECSNQVDYHPMGTERADGVAYGAPKSFNQESYYSYGYKKFKSKREAINYCLSD